MPGPDLLDDPRDAVAVLDRPVERPLDVGPRGLDDLLPVGLREGLAEKRLRRLDEPVRIVVEGGSGRQLDPQVLQDALGIAALHALGGGEQFEFGPPALQDRPHDGSRGGLVQIALPFRSVPGLPQHEVGLAFSVVLVGGPFGSR